MIYPKVSSSNNAQTEASNINTIKASVSSLYSSSPDYNGLTTDVGIKSKIFPDTMVNTAGTAALNTFKGPVTITTSKDSISRAENSAFLITYSNVPSSECVKIVSAVQNNFYKVSVGGTIVKSGAFTPGIFDITRLTTECAKGNSTIVFTAI
jgi:hypothetical protein